MCFEATISDKLEYAVRMDRVRWGLPSLGAESAVKAQRPLLTMQMSSAQIAGPDPESDGAGLCGAASFVVRPRI